MRKNVFFIFAFLILTGCEAESPSVNQDLPPKARPVKLIDVGTSDTVDLLHYPAVIKAGQSSDIAFQVNGVLKELLVNEAQEVKKGEILARLDQRNFKEDVNSARATYDSANSEYKRALKLFKEDAIAKSVLEQRKSKRDVSKASLETAKKALEDTFITAPFSGVISVVSIKINDAVQTGKSVINMINIGEREAIVNMPASIVAKAKNKDNSHDGEFVVLDASPNQRIPATFKEISLEADTASQTYEVTFTFTAPDDLVILPGMNATVWVKDFTSNTENSNFLSIPLTAILTEGDQKYVWVVDKESMLVSKQAIVVGKSVGETLNVISGLKQGQTVVGAGASYLSEGMKVRPWVK